VSDSPLKEFIERQFTEEISMIQQRFWKVCSAIVGSAVLGASMTVPVHAQQKSDIVSFELTPNPAVLACMAADPKVTPRAYVYIKPGALNDKAVVGLSGFKPGLQFALFTTEKSILKADGTNDPNFKNFGLAWYQTEVIGGWNTFQTILIDEPFGFNPDVNMPPTRTFHVGFWFADPNDAAKCGFDPAKPLTFDGDLESGPVAFISRPDATTGLGPLCITPNTSTNPVSCGEP
jgi:hypothetical protein